VFETTKKIIEYMMHRNERGNLITPHFISDGGYFPHNNRYIGIIDDESEYYVPKTKKDSIYSDLEEFDDKEFEDLIISLDFFNEDGVPLTELEKINIATNWLTEKGIEIK
jgi:hypothetical protein